MQIIKLLITFIFVFSYSSANNCDQQLIGLLKNSLNENLSNSENFQALVRKRAEVALIKSSLTFYKVQQNCKADKAYVQKLEKDLERYYAPYNIEVKGAMFLYLQGQLGLQEEKIDYSKMSEDEVKALIAESIKNPITPMQQIELTAAAMDKAEKEKFPQEKLTEQMLNRALAGPSYVMFPKQKEYHINTVDLFFLRKALKTDNKGNPTLLDFTLSQMKKHFPERAFPENDEKAMKAASTDTVKEFKDLFAKEIAGQIPTLIKQLDEKCQEELKSLLDADNAACAATNLIDNKFSDFEDILMALQSKNPEIQNVFLHVAGAKANVNCEIEELDGKYRLTIDARLTNFEGINKSHWSFKAGDKSLPIQNTEKKAEFGFRQTIEFDGQDNIPKTIKLDHDNRINADLDLNFQGSQQDSREMNLENCIGHPSKVPVNVPQQAKPKPKTKPDVVPTNDDHKKDDDMEFDIELTKEPSDTHYKLTMKTEETCRYSTCSFEKYQKKAKGCKTVADNSHKFKRGLKKGFNVYIQCKDKDEEDTKKQWKPYRSKTGKEIKTYIDICSGSKCMSSKKRDNFRMPVIPPAPPQSPQQQIKVPDIPILLEG